MITDSLFLNILFSAPPFLFAIITHEVAHGYVAYKLGDPTAKALNRITFNPFRHIDLFMSILLPGFLIISGSPIIFGGAKPVPVNPGYFKNPKRDMALVAAAGPIVNFILAFISFHLYTYYSSFNFSGFIAVLIQVWLALSLIINTVLGLFNLIPIPPLDGGRIMVGILPLPLARSWAKLERYGILIVFLLLMLEIPQKILDPAISFVSKELAKKIQGIDNIEKTVEPIPERKKPKSKVNQIDNELELT